MPGYHWLPDGLKLRAQARRGRRDARWLSREIPEISTPKPDGPAGALIEEIPQRLVEYVRAAGTDEIMAASPELLRFLVTWCEARRPARLVDLGSGITSWVLRAWRDRCSPESVVVSVDDSAEWLERSRAYSRDAGAGDEGFLTWSEFLAAPEPDDFDLVVHDLGSVRERARVMEHAFELVSPHGAIVCDDIHKARVWRAARRASRRTGMAGRSLREQTLDPIGRFALIAFRSSKPG